MSFANVLLICKLVLLIVGCYFIHLIIFLAFKLGYSNEMDWMQWKSLEILSTLTDFVTSEVQTAVLKMYKSIFYCM